MNHAHNSEIVVLSFGFKFGLPRANYYFDVTFLKNPARLNAATLTSLVDDAMFDYVVSQPEAQKVLDITFELAVTVSDIPADCVLAFGCNSGRHRSHVMATALAKRLEESGRRVHCEHRDLGA